MSDNTIQLPLVPLRDMVVFPSMMAPFVVGRRASIQALEAIAEEALKRNVGARGLKIIIEELMLEIMYTIPSQDAISECMITREVVLSHSQPITSYRKAG